MVGSDFLQKLKFGQHFRMPDLCDPSEFTLNIDADLIILSSGKLKKNYHPLNQ